jgi:type II secretory pathway component GspD/PulD (secretin)
MEMLAAFSLSILVSAAAAPPAPAEVRLDFKEKGWKDVLNTVSAPLGLSLQIEFDPPGTFTYSDPKPMAPEKAMEIVHGALLDRGITLIRSGKLIVAVRLAENLHQALTSFCPAEEVVLRRDNEYVFTTVKLNSLTGSQAKSELGSLLSPRGKIAETGVANRIAVLDRCDSVREFIKVLAIVDAPGKNNTVPLRTYQLKYARAHDAVQVLSKLLAAPQGPAAPGGPQLPPGIQNIIPNFERMGAALGDKRVVQSFAPGININSAVPGQSIGGSLGMPTEIESDEGRNMVFVRADRDKLAIADRVIQSLDQPSFSETSAGGDSVEIRTYRLSDNNGDKVAAALRSAHSATPGFFAEGAENRLFVKAPRRRMLEVEATLARLAPDKPEFAVFPVPEGSAKDLAKQLMSLFESEPEANRPKIVADGRDDRLMVRGTQRQVELVKTFAKDFAVPEFTRPEVPPTRKSNSEQEK